MMRIICLVLLVLLSALPAGTPSLAAAADLPAAAAAEYSRGRELYQADALQESLAVLRDFVQRYPTHPQTPQAYTLIGRIFTRQQRYAEALLYLERVPRGLRSPEARLLAGYCQVRSGDHAAGREQLLPLLEQSFSQADTERLLRALIEADLESGRPLQTLVFHHRLLPFSEQPARQLDEVHQILQNRLSDSELEEAAFMWSGTVIGQDARLQLARRALARQDRQLAQQQLQLVLASPVTFPYWEEAQQLLARTSVDSYLSRDTVGVLLPLSGRYASYGELVKKGLELALQQHNQAQLPVRFIYLDTASDGVTASQLVSRLTDDEKVMAIIGPLTGAAAEDAAYRAQREMVPLLTLSQRDGLPQSGNFVFRDSLTAQAQVQALVRQALADDHISFSVLHPENRLGEEMTRLFIAEVEKQGGEIVDVISYPEDATDFRRQIKQLLWEDPDERKFAADAAEADQLPELEYPLPPFHALFIPDYAERLGLLAPQLMFYGIKDATLLGTNGWNSPELIRRAGRFLQQAVFVDGFFGDSRKPEVRRFVELYRQAYQEEPTILQAQAFDVANLVLQLIDDPAIRNRDDFRRALADLGGFRGVTGTTGFDTQGEVVKQLYLLKVKRGKVVEIN